MFGSEDNPRGQQLISISDTANRRSTQANKKKFKSPQNSDFTPFHHPPFVTRLVNTDSNMYYNKGIEYPMETDDLQHQMNVTRHKFDTKHPLPKPVLAKDDEVQFSTVHNLNERDHHVYMDDSKSSSRSSLSKLSNYSRLYQTTRTSLSLRGRELTSLPKYLFKMRNLEKLTLSPEREACLEVYVHEFNSFSFISLKVNFYF